jgi:hypothetical protein
VDWTDPDYGSIWFCADDHELPGCMIPDTYNKSQKHIVRNIIKRCTLWTPCTWPEEHYNTDMATWFREHVYRMTNLEDGVNELSLQRIEKPSMLKRTRCYVLQLRLINLLINVFIYVSEEVRKILNWGTWDSSWIYYQHSCELVSNARHCLILTKRSKFLYLLSPTPQQTPSNGNAGL